MASNNRPPPPRLTPNRSPAILVTDVRPDSSTNAEAAAAAAAAARRSGSAALSTASSTASSASSSASASGAAAGAAAGGQQALLRQTQIPTRRYRDDIHATDDDDADFFTDAPRRRPSAAGSAAAALLRTPRKLLRSASSGLARQQQQQQQQQGGYSSISVSNLLFEHGESDIPSSHRRSPQQQSQQQMLSSASSFAPYTSAPRGVYTRAQTTAVAGAGARRGGYEDVPMQSRLPQRNPRLMIQASRTSKPRRRIVSGYTAYHDDEEDEDEDDEDGNNGTSSGYGRRYDLDGGNANSGSDSSDDSGSGSDDESMIGDEDYEEAQRRPGRRVVYLPPVPEPAGHYNELHPTVAGTRRVTAYHIAEEFDLRQINKFAMQTHDVVDSLGFEGNGDDDALYLSYGLPMVPGKDGYRVRSGRREAYFPLAAATKAVGYFGGSGKRAADASGGVSAVNDEREMEPTSAVDDDSKALLRPGPETTEFSSEQQEQEQQEQQEQQQYSREVDHDDYFGDDHHSDDGNEDYAEHMYNESTQRAELFLFGYGVVVFWNFTETQERDIMADFMFSNHDATAFGGNLMSRILPEHDRETETFRFEYTMNENSRIFNDLIILRAHRSNKLNVKSKLTMSHAIAQSTILSYFETKMETVTIRELEIVPARLALLGTTPRLTREDLLKIEGKLFGLRVEVNLSSSVLDVPTFFWETEPGMQEFYDMVREYLEIKPRIKILNKRCQVFLDLADILGDSIAERNMSRITWIIIVLIVVSLCVTTLEIIMRFSVLSKLQPVPIDDDGASSAAINATADSPHAYLA